MNLFDSHAHYNDEKFDIDREKIIKETLNNGVSNFIVAGYNIESSIKAVEIAQKYKEAYAIVGISPNDLENIKTTEDINDLIYKLENIINGNLQCMGRTLGQSVNYKKNNIKMEREINNKIVAIGEIGLDYYWNKENKEIQKEIFIKQIEIANKYELPIVIHTREAVNDTLQILRENQVVKKGIFHCCPLNRELIKEALRLDYYISLSGVITFKNAKNAEEIINLIPDDKLLIETDSPYLSPEPLRGKRNNSINVKYVAEKIANVKNKTLEEIADITRKNAKRIFSIDV